MTNPRPGCGSGGEAVAAAAAVRDSRAGGFRGGARVSGPARSSGVCTEAHPCRGLVFTLTFRPSWRSCDLPDTLSFINPFPASNSCSGLSCWQVGAHFALSQGPAWRAWSEQALVSGPCCSGRDGQTDASGGSVCRRANDELTRQGAGPQEEHRSGGQS